MSAVVILEWKYSPSDYFKSQIQIEQYDYSIIIANGKAEAKIKSAVYKANISMRDTLDDVLISLYMLFSIFLGTQACSREAYVLSSPNLTHVENADGRKDYALEAESGRLKITGYSANLLKNDRNEDVVEDSQTEIMKTFIDQVSRHHKDRVLMSLLKSHTASVNDPDDELVHLYEIRDALSRKFGSDAMARSALRISEKNWSSFGRLCNHEPLRQGRHRGEHENLRDATDNELSEVRGIARVMISAYLNYLDMAVTSTASQKYAPMHTRSIGHS